MKNRMVLRCVDCGAGILTTDKNRSCYKCGARMEFECMENKFERYSKKKK